MKKYFGLLVGLLLFFGITGFASAVTIDGTISVGEWTGATTATIGGGGGTAYFFADTNYVYGAFDITGWTESDLSTTTHGFVLGFGVWAADNSYPGDGVEFQQANSEAAWGGPVGVNSGTMNGLLSAFRIDAGTPEASIPGDLEAMDSFDTGHRVWEVMMPISTMTVVDDTVWVVGGINYGGLQHWYPETFLPSYNGYIEVTVEAGTAPVPEPATMLLFGIGLLGLAGVNRRKK